MRAQRNPRTMPTCRLFRLRRLGGRLWAGCENVTCGIEVCAIFVDGVRFLISLKDHRCFLLPLLFGGPSLRPFSLSPPVGFVGNSSWYAHA